MRVLSLFSGIGGFDLGFKRAGMVIDSVCELDEAARSILGRHFKGAKQFSDVREIGASTHERGTIDLICGGFPCQDVSIAGGRAGLAGERSGLWWEFARVIDELEPRWVVIENVPGLLSSCGCATCGAVRRIHKVHGYIRRKRKIGQQCAVCLEGKRLLESHKGRDFAKIVHWLAERGYGVSWRILDSQYIGVAQRRRRVFIVGSLGSGRSAEVLFESDGGGWDIEARRQAGQGPAGTAVINLANAGANQNNVKVTDTADTLDTWATQAVSPITIVEQNNVASTPGMVSLSANPAQPVICFDANQNLADLSEGIAPTMRHNGDGKSAHSAYPKISVMAHGQGNAEIMEDGSPSLTANHEQPIIFSGELGIMSRDGRKPNENIVGTQRDYMGDNQPTVWQMNHASEAYRENGELAPTLQERMGTGGNNVPLVGVRRLTPVECERLQGFPDNWTRFGVVRTPVHDEEGAVMGWDVVTRKQADSTRYRQLGNAVTVNAAEWIGRRIVEFAS